MKYKKAHIFKTFVYRLLLLAVLLFGALTVSAMFLGALGFGVGVGLLMLTVLVLNVVCGLLLPTSQSSVSKPQAPVRTVARPMPPSPALRVVRGGGSAA